MESLPLAFGSFNQNLHAPNRQVSIRSIQFVLAALQYEEASRDSALTLWCPCLECQGRRSVCPHLCTPLHTTCWHIANTYMRYGTTPFTL